MVNHPISASEAYDDRRRRRSVELASVRCSIHGALQLAGIAQTTSRSRWISTGVMRTSSAPTYTLTSVRIPISPGT